jgi:hypothetical protein
LLIRSSCRISVFTTKEDILLLTTAQLSCVPIAESLILVLSELLVPFLFLSSLSFVHVQLFTHSIASYCSEVMDGIFNSVRFEVAIYFQTGSGTTLAKELLGTK